MDRRRRASLALAGISLASLIALVLLFTLNPGSDAAGQGLAGPASLAEEGEALFLAKGCIRCHRHASVENASRLTFDIGPNLTNYTGDPAFLRRWLRDPQTVVPSTPMPNLALSDDEIDRLIAFLNRPT